MPRTYTLKWLLAVVTLAAVVAGIAVNYPRYSLPLLAVGGWFAPAVVVSLVLSHLSPRPRVTLLVACFGAMLGWVIIAFPFVSQERFVFASWHVYSTHYLLLSMIPACGAVLFGGVSCIDRAR
jgi:hypothetical protein